MKLSKILPLAALVLLTACSKSGHAPTASTASTAAPAATAEKPVATVNGTPISRDMFEFYAKSTAGKPASELSADQRSELLDNLVRGEIIAQQAEKDGLENSGDTASLLALSRLQILEQAGAEHYLADKKPTQQELQAEYDQQIAAMPKEQYHARHILVPTQAEAQQIIDQLKHGAKFADLAKKDSIDSSKEQGGDLGWFSPTNMVKPFADAVASLKKGETTPAPVQTQYGWHVIQLLDTRETPVPSLDQVKDRVAQLVQTKEFRAYQDQLLKTAKVEKDNNL
ncbi:MAG TPA: peptidylprolyl isomerase [Steroidobacteraceae bacterium]|jgi:peptidyl-prolyl cis-trans isomerase C|nr:peptidylprolyl isomerase [Steroidobacteraceae bacterium]